MNPIGNLLKSKVGFADLYLERYGSGSGEVLPEPDPDLFLIVTIPSFKEPDLAESVRSLLACDPPGVKWEIIININYPENSTPDVAEISRQSLESVLDLSKSLDRTDVQILCLWNPDLKARHAGVGLARKIAMDEATRRFNTIGRPDGVILAFDADSSCSLGYLKSVSTFYSHHKGARTANIYFEHPLSGEYDKRIYDSISQYELYLRYMRLAIEKTGHPYSIHTVGSSFSLRCKTYIRVNGMGRDKAGEDFYFLHKCIQLKGFWEINNSAVRPSVRESDRVIFGTGASIHRQMQNEATLEVYDMDSFEPLTKLFGRVGVYWQTLSEKGDTDTDWEGISPFLSEFLLRQNAKSRILGMFRDSASESTFRDKFFSWFNAFMVLRYLNDAHRNDYQKKPVISESNRLATVLGIEKSEQAEYLLVNFRNYERGRGNRRII